MKKSFENLLFKHPYKTKMATGGLLVGTGDLIAQNIIEKTPKYDPERTIRLMLLGGCFLAPVQRLWIDLVLPKIAGGGKTGTKSAIAIRKSLLDSFVFGTVMNTCYVGLNMYLSGDVAKDKIVSKMKDEQFGIVLTGWSYWIPIQMINYRFVPLNYQMNATQVLALVWHSFLSWKAHKNLKHDEEVQDRKIIKANDEDQLK